MFLKLLDIIILDYFSATISVAMASVTDLNQNSNGAVPIIIDIFHYFLLIIISF